MKKERTGNWEDTEEKLEQKQEDCSNTNNEESTEKKPEQQQEDSTNIESIEKQGSTEEKIEQKQEENINTNSIKKQESTKKKIEQKQEESINTNSIKKQESTKKKIEQKQEESINTDSIEKQEDTEEKLENQESTEEKIERKQEESINTDSIEKQESTEKKIEQNQEDCTNIENTENQENTEEKPEQKQIIEGSTEIKKSKKSSEANLKLKIKVANAKYSSRNSEIITEQKTGVCNGTKTLESTEVKPELKIRARIGTHNPANEEVTPEIKPEASSWTNMKLILAYPYSIHSFYTTQDKIDIRYKGSAALRQQKVDVYLVKERNLSFPEEAVTDVTDVTDENTIGFEDVFNKNAESYIQIPATLNEGGNLPSLTLGPLPAGNYQVFITLAGNGTETPETEKKVLLANHFEVLEYEMEAKAPNTLEEGENLEVNMTLKNAPAHESYTYWAVLIREDPYRANMNTGSSGTRSGTDPFLKGLDIIRNFGINSINYESDSGKTQLKKEIQTLLGKNNGTISIGEENQNTLSLTSLGLPPGTYLLYAGAYEKDKGLASITQKKLTIFAPKTENLGLKSHSSTQNSDSTPSIKSKAPAPATLEPKKSIFETIKTFGLEDLQPHIQGRSLAEVIKNPPKIPSFLLGFAGTLLITLAVMRTKR